MEKRYVKLYEEFIDADYDMQHIMNSLTKRAESWFQGTDGGEEIGILAKNGAVRVQIHPTETAVAMRKSLIVEFKDEDFYYQLIIRTNIEKMDKCDIILKKYDLNNYETGDLTMIDQLSLTGEESIDVDDVKGKFILDQIAKLNGKSKNPDENEIKVPKEDEEVPPAEAPPDGSPPSEPAQGTPPPAQGGTPPAQGGTPAI